LKFAYPSPLNLLTSFWRPPVFLAFRRLMVDSPLIILPAGLSFPSRAPLLRFAGSGTCPPLLFLGMLTLAPRLETLCSSSTGWHFYGPENGTSVLFLFHPPLIILFGFFLRPIPFSLSCQSLRPFLIAPLILFSPLKKSLILVNVQVPSPISFEHRPSPGPPRPKRCPPPMSTEDAFLESISPLKFDIFDRFPPRSLPAAPPRLGDFFGSAFSPFNSFEVLGDQPANELWSRYSLHCGMWKYVSFFFPINRELGRCPDILRPMNTGFQSYQLFFLRRYPCPYLVLSLSPRPELTPPSFMLSFRARDLPFKFSPEKSCFVSLQLR